MDTISEIIMRCLYKSERKAVKEDLARSEGEQESIGRVK